MYPQSNIIHLLISI